MAAIVSQSTGPKGRSGHTFLAYGDNAVLLGGYDESGALDDIWMFEAERGVWVQCSYNRLNPHPLPRVDFDCCILGSKLYLFGGMQSDGEQVLIVNDLWCLDLNSGIWTMVTEECPVPERMGYVCVALDDSHMLVHGGECMGKCLDDIWLYDANTNVWQTYEKPNNHKPVGRCSHSGCFLPESQTFLVFGGYTIEEGAPVYLNDLWSIDISTIASANWKQVQCADSSAITPSPRDLPALVALPNSRVLIAGGFGLVEVDDAMMTEEGEGEGGDGVELSYLGDFWTVDVNVAASTSIYTQLYGEEEQGDTLWADASGRRGCKVLARPDGSLLSFGGFNGEGFCSALEATVLS